MKKSKYGVVTIENHLDIGGLGSAVADVIAEDGLGKRLVKIGLPGYPRCIPNVPDEEVRH
ncbi:MAG: hypothetical protein ACLT4C_05915 [Butyricicoccus sp.]